MSIEITDDGDIMLGDLSLRELEERLKELTVLIKEVEKLKEDIKELKSKKIGLYEKHNQ